MMLHARDEDGSQMTDEQLLDETRTFLLAGHETTAITLSWSLFLLAKTSRRASPAACRGSIPCWAIACRR